MRSANSECRCELIIENQKSWELPIYSSNSNYLIYEPDRQFLQPDRIFSYLDRESRIPD